MLNLPHIHFFLYILCAMHIVWFGVAGSWLFLHRKEQHDRSRLFIGGFFLYAGFGCFNFIITGMARGDLDAFLTTILEPYPLILSFLPALCMSLYVLEIQKSHWLQWRRFILSLLPWLTVVIAWLIYHAMHHWQYDAITHLMEINQILPNIHKTDVLLRVLLASVYLPYGCVILFFRYNWRTSNLSAHYLWGLKLLIMLCYLGFIFGMVMRVSEIIIVYFVTLDILSIYVFVIEYTARIPVPEDLPELSNTEEPASQLSYLAQRLQQMLEQKIWQDPDLDRNDVCQLLATNRTYLTNAIQELGYVSFQDMISKQRVQYVHDELQKNPYASISDLFFHAGFRNRTTPIRYFTQVYGCSPSEFVKKGKK